MRDPLLGDDVAALIDGELVLAVHGVNLCLLPLPNEYNCEGNAVT